MMVLRGLYQEISLISLTSDGAGNGNENNIYCHILTSVHFVTDLISE